MKYFLLCLIGGLSIGAKAQSIPSLSEVTIAGDGEVLTGSLSANMEGRSYSCQGGVLVGKFSVLTCGDQRQAQVEMQSFAGDSQALVAFYESGRQLGVLFLYQKSGSNFVQSNAPVVFTPGFGSLNQFQRYVIDPMLREMNIDKVFEILPELMAQVGPTMTLSQIRDRVANKEYRAWLPKPEPKPEPIPESKPAPKEETPDASDAVEDQSTIEEGQVTEPPKSLTQEKDGAGDNSNEEQLPPDEMDIPEDQIRDQINEETPKTNPEPGPKPKPQVKQPKPKKPVPDYLDDPFGSDEDMKLP